MDIMTTLVKNESLTFTLIAVALFALIVSGIALWLFTRLVRRERQLAAYKTCNFDPEGYAVPDAQVDTVKPEKIDVGNSFVLVGMLDVPRLQQFSVDYVTFLLTFRNYGDALNALFNGSAQDEDLTEIRRLLQDKKAYAFIGQVIDRAILKNAKANPNKLKIKHFLKVMEPDQLQRILYALWSYNFGLQFKKKLEAQIKVVQEHMQWDLSGRTKSESARPSTP
jgi:hypothetical protein